MYPKISKIFSRLSALLIILITFFILSGCEENRGPRGEKALRNALGVLTAQGRNVYVLSEVRGTVLDSMLASTSTVREGLTRDTTPRSSGSYGVISRIAVSDSSEITNMRSREALQFNPPLDEGAGISGYNTGRSAILTKRVSKDSFMDILPDGSALIISHPDERYLTQLILNESGGFAEQKLIPIDARPTRFVATHNFEGNNKFIYVATDKGVATVTFKGLASYGAAGRVVGAITPVVLPTSNIPIGTRVLDIALSQDDQTAYIINEYRQVFYKDKVYLDQQLPFQSIEQLGFQPLKLASPPPAAYVPFSDAIAALTPSGMNFVNAVDTQLLFNWNRLRSYGPVDVEYHSDGQSVLILTNTKIFRASLLSPAIGIYSDGIYVGEDAREMAIDKIEGKFVVVAVKGAVTLCPLDNYGIVSPPGTYGTVKVPGETIAVAVK